MAETLTPKKTRRVERDEKARLRRLKDLQRKAALTAEALEDEIANVEDEPLAPAADYLKAIAPEVEEKCDEPMNVMPYGGAVTIADALAAMEAQEQARAVNEASWLFQTVVNNILASDELTDKAGAISTAAKELQALLKDPTPLMKEADAAPEPSPTPEALPTKNPATLWQKFLAVLHLDKQEAPQAVKESETKVGARHRASDQDALDAAHEAIVKAGANCGMKVLKDIQGNYRWFGWVSNKFRDRDTRKHPKGEIISEAAHKEFIAWLDANPQKAPEHWVWHTPQTAFKSKTDWWDYADGFLVMSGPMTTEEAKSYSDDEVVAMSHGFHVLARDKANGIIEQYRMFENSDLPPDRAANPFTLFDVVRKEAEMPFEKDRREYLVKRLGEERVKALESDTAAMSKALADLDVEFKETTSGAVAPTPAPAPGDGDLTGVVEQLKGALNLEGLNALITELQTSNHRLTEKLDAQAKELAGMRKSDDEKVAETIKPKLTPMQWGYRPSAAKDNVVTDEAEKEKIDKEQQPSWVQQAFGSK